MASERSTDQDRDNSSVTESSCPPELGVLLMLRDIPPNVGAWHIPGGTVLFGERLTDAVGRVARDELGIEVTVGDLLGYIEYPSHYENGLDSPVGLAFRTMPAAGVPG